MRVIEGVIPPGGWHYLQDGTQRIESHSFLQLVAAVQEWRLQNQRDVGDPMSDVVTQICQRFPAQCHRGRSSAPHQQAMTQPQRQQERWIDRLIRWGTSCFYDGKTKDLEIEGEAQRRAQICQQCPQNEKWADSCPNCVERAGQLFTMMRRGREVSNWRKLHGCKVFDHDNRTACWMKREHLGEAAKAPANCWLK